MASIAKQFLYTIFVLLVSTTLILSEKNSTEGRAKRNNNEFHPHLHYSRRPHNGKSYSASYNKFQPLNVAGHTRPRFPSHSKPIHIPPYAIKMEPLVHYSQRDPLYNVKEPTYNVSLTEDLEKHSPAETFAESSNNFIEYPPRYGAPPPSYNVGPTFHQLYKEPEPIIEIIIKESNETLPTPVAPTFPSTTTFKEPIQVFYVKYNKNRTHTGKEEVVYEEPVPALTLLPTDLVENHSSIEHYQPITTTHPNSSPPSTTYRTLIRPESEVYHGTGLKVTFGNHEGDLGHNSRSSEAQKRDSIDYNEAQSEIKTGVSDFTPKPVAENRQSQIDYTQFINTNEPVLTNPSHTFYQRQNQPQINPEHHHTQPLQIEDGSFEQPPPPPYNLQNSQSNKIVFPSAHQNIPFRPQHILNLQSNLNEFQDFSLLQRQTQNQFQFLYPHLGAQNTQNKLFPRVTPAILQQLPLSQNQQYQNADLSFSQPPLSNNIFNGKQNLINLNNKLEQQNANTQSQSVPNILNDVYNPQLLKPYIRNEYFHQQYSIQNPQHVPQQQLPTVDLQNHFQYEKTKQSSRRPIENNKHSVPEFKHFQPPGKSVENKPVQQPNYQNVVPSSHHHQQTKAQKGTIKSESTTSIPIHDGQILKSISHSEEHEIIQGDPFISRLNQQQLQQQHSHQNQELLHLQQPPKPSVNLASHPEAQNFKPPKQTFDQWPVHQTTTAKLATKYEELNKTETQINLKTQKKEPQSIKENEKVNTKLTSQLAALPDEVPDDLREQLLSSGILSNADIQILDYDKVGDIPIDNLPPEALENLYGSGSAPVPSISLVNASKSAVEKKVIQYDPSTSAGQSIPNSYIQEDSTEVDPVVLNDSSYNRYLPLKVKGSQFPIPNSPLLKNKKITSVVVLAPVDYEYVQQEPERQGKNVPQVHGVRFISGDSLKALVRNPTHDNFFRWIEKERQTPANKQSVILLVTNSTDEIQPEPTTNEIFMYDVLTGEINKLEGELSVAFINVAEFNAESDDLGNLSEQNEEKPQTVRVTSSASVQLTTSDKQKYRLIKTPES